MTVLGRNITRLRKERKWTQTTLARKAGIAAPYLNQIEHGVRVGGWKTHFAIARALDVTLKELNQPQDPDMAEAEAEAAAEFHQAIDDLKIIVGKAARTSDTPADVYLNAAKRIRGVAGLTA